MNHSASGNTSQTKALTPVYCFGKMLRQDMDIEEHKLKKQTKKRQRDGLHHLLHMKVCERRGRWPF